MVNNGLYIYIYVTWQVDISKTTCWMLTPGKIHAVQAEGDKESAEKPRFDIQAKTITLSIHGQIWKVSLNHVFSKRWKSDEISSDELSCKMPHQNIRHHKFFLPQVNIEELWAPSKILPN